MDSLIKKFERFISKEQLFGFEHKLLVAVSGGLDSMVLSQLLQASGFSFAIAHCNFQLRGEDSTGDADFVANYANNMGLTFFHKEFDTQAFMAEHKLAVQEAARILRYEWFEELMQEHGFDYLITAHHANDQTETMLYNLTKGTGAAGLRGIPVINGNIRRPLLFAKREEIEKHASQINLQWREDASNQEDKYSRNRIRNQVIPELRKINPGLEQTMRNNSLRFAAMESLILHEVARIRDQSLSQSKDVSILNMDWYKEDDGGLAILSELLKSFGFNWGQCLSIAKGMTASPPQSGKMYYAKDFRLLVDRNQMMIEPNNTETNVEIEVDEFADFANTPWSTFTMEISDSVEEWTTNTDEAYLDADLVEFPIKIRNWEQGDAFFPLGMKGKKKLSDFMIDEKIPVNLKSRVLLFESNNEIIWVAGHRIDDRFKITPNTKRVLIIKMTDHV